MTTIFFLTFLVLLALFYVIGLFNLKVAKKVDLVLFALSRFKLNRKNAKKAPSQFNRLIRIIIYRRQLLLRKIAADHIIKELEKQKPV